MRLRPVLALAVLVTSVLGVTAAVNAPANFDLTLSRTATGWTATCAEGCAWKEVAMDCVGGCQAVVSELGMRTERVAGIEREAFAFVAEPRGVGGWRAVSIRGTSWSETSVGCGQTSCRTRVDGSGISQR